GMFYYAIARNPWVPHVHDVDSPAYRHSRILYTSLCWLLSGGNGFALIWVMPAVNLLAIAGMAWLGAWVADRYAMSPWWGFVVPLAVNACIPALRDLTDGVSTLMVFALLAAGFLQRRWWLMALLGLAALCSREQNALIVLILFLSAVRHRDWWTAGGLV